MLMNEGQIYRCINTSCLCEVKVIRGSMEASSNPRCCCGTEMKKPYAKPTLQELTSDMKVLARTNGR
jgi:hypothetical protein